MPAHERRAAEVSAELLVALEKVAAFAVAYQPIQNTQDVVDRSAGVLLPAGETRRTRQLLRIVEEHLPDLDPRVQDSERKVVGPRAVVVNADPNSVEEAIRRGDVKTWTERLSWEARHPAGRDREDPIIKVDLIADQARRPGWFGFLEPGPAGWKIPPRQRIVVLLRDHLGYWKNFGLKEAASHRTMAIASLLAGNWPTDYRSKRGSAKRGVTVADVLKSETHAIRAAVQKLRAGPDAKKNRRFRASLKMPARSGVKRGSTRTK
ncbi:MAG TPA: hypothetical protein VH853_06895 [Polyangia bacterium]|nr:hypothetical protein [Polyangia bacterium]